MIKLSCLGVGLDDEFLNSLKSVRPYELTFSATACGIREARVLLDTIIVQAVIIEEKVGEPTIEFINFLKTLPSRPIVAVVSKNATAFQGIAHVSFDYNVAVPDLAQKLLSLPSERKAPSLEISLQKDKALDERLAKIFISAGIPPHIKGYQFLREAVKQAVYDPNMINNITKSLYPAVAERFQTTPSKVERAIRHAIEVAWNRGKIENINSIYGIKIFARGDKPTNGELIALVSDKLLIECS
jgi:hypothetical protein